MLIKEDVQKIINTNALEKALKFSLVDNSNLSNIETLADIIVTPDKGAAYSREKQKYIINAASVVSALTGNPEEVNIGDTILNQLNYLKSVANDGLALPVDQLDLFAENIILLIEKLRGMAVETLSEKGLLKLGVSPSIFMDAVNKVKANPESASIIMSSGVVNAINKLSIYLTTLSDMVLSINTYVGGDAALLDMVSAQANRPSIYTYRLSKLRDLSETVRQSLNILKDNNYTGQRDMTALLDGSVDTMLEYDEYILSEENLMTNLFNVFDAAISDLASLRLDGLQTIYDAIGDESKVLLIGIKLKVDLLLDLILINGRILEDFLEIANDSESSDMSGL